MVKQVRMATDFMAGAGDQLPAGEGADPVGAGLETIALQADQLQLQGPEDGQAGPAGELAQVPELTNGKRIEGALIMLRDVFCAFTGFTSPKENFTDQAAAAMGEAWGKVADKYGLDLGSIAGDYQTEIAAAIVTLPIAMAVAQGVKVEMAARAKKKPIEAGDKTAAPGEEGADGVAPGRPQIVSNFPKAH